jgi:radical SAM superfamily enzyme YgiQ (UPF0313 family)
MMLVPSTAIGLFTHILKQEGMVVDLFDTTHYEHETTVSAERKVETLQYRSFDAERDLGFERVPGDRLLDDFVARVDAVDPDLILVSVVEDTFKQALHLLAAIHARGIPTLVGGVFVTAAPEVAIASPFVSLIAVGEGEETVRLVATRLRDGLAIDDVPSLWIKHEDGRITRNPVGPLVDLNRPIPDFSLFDERRFLRPMGGRVFRTVPVESYRGCPYACTFCNSPMQVTLARDNALGPFLRRKRIDRLREELREMVERYDAEYIYFVDDSFLSRPQRELDDFIEMYAEFRLPFWFNTRPEGVTRELLERLRAVGLDRLSVGLEHGNEEFRRRELKRQPSNETLLAHFDILAASGVAFSVNNIIGFPGETRELVLETIEFNRRLRGFDALTVSIFTPYRGTVLRQRAVDMGYLDPDTFTTHTTSSSLLSMPHLTSEAIDGLYRTFMMYVRFERELWPEIQRAERFDEEGNRVWRRLFELYQERWFAVDQDGKPIRASLPAESRELRHPRGDHWEEVFGAMSKTQAR